MKKLLAIFRGLAIGVTGLALGFAVGSWTPLGQMGSLKNVSALAHKSAYLSAFLGNPDQATIAPQQIRAEFQPWIARAGQLYQLGTSQDNQAAAVAVLAKALSETPKASNSSLLQSASATSITSAKYGQSYIFADSPNAEIARVIGAIESENQQIVFYLQSHSPQEPEYQLTRSIYESNNQWLEVLRFMVERNKGATTNQNAALLKPLLQQLDQKVGEATNTGRVLVRQTLEHLEDLKINSSQERAFKDMLITFTESYEFSFQVEEELTTAVLEYPDLILKAPDGETMSNQIATWDTQTLELVNQRMTLKALRQEMAMNLTVGPMS